MSNVLSTILNFSLIYFFGFFIGLFTRKNIHFGVTINPRYIHDKRLGRIRAQYTRVYGLGGGLLLLLFIYLSIQYRWDIVYTIFMIIWFISLGILYGYYNGKVKALKKELYSGEEQLKPIVASASLSNRAVEMPSIKLHFIIPSILCLLTIGFSVILWENIPGQVPMHYNGMGEVTRYADKSIWTVGLLPMTQLLMMLLLYYSTYFSIKYSKRKLNPRKPRVSEAQYNIAMNRFSIMMAIVAGVLNFQLLFLQLLIIQGTEMNTIWFNIVIYGMVIVIFIPLAWFFVTTGMTGEKVELDFNEPESDVEEDDDDDKWIWGMFYYNKDDASIFVPKRFGGGFTINMATKGGVIFMIIVLGIILGVVGLPYILGM